MTQPCRGRQDRVTQSTQGVWNLRNSPSCRKGVLVVRFEDSTIPYMRRDDLGLCDTTSQYCKLSKSDFAVTKVVKTFG